MDNGQWTMVVSALRTILIVGFADTFIVNCQLSIVNSFNDNVSTKGLLLGLFQFLGLVGCGQGVDDLVDGAVHDSVDLIQGQADAMVCDTALREIVGADALVSHAGADLAATHAGNFRIQLFLLDLVNL